MTDARLRERVLRQRLATQRLSAAPFPAAADAVRLLGAVQSQERDQALYSLALRARSATCATVRSELDAGAFVRTHVLRPTWHFVAPEDLRWMLALTSPRVLSGMAARHRELGLDDPRLASRSVDAVTTMLAGRNYLTRNEIGARLSGRRGVAQPGVQLGHLLLVAELRGLICSGPTKGVQHSYALLDEVIAPTPDRAPDQATTDLVLRFFLGHGPASVKDFTRWSSLTVAATEAALAGLRDRLDSFEVDGVRQWYDPSGPVPARTRPRGYLLPVYDEVALTYPRLGFPVLQGHRHEHAANPWLADAFVGGVVAGLRNVGTWKRTVSRTTVTVRVDLTTSAGPHERRLVREAAARLADIHERELVYQD